MRLKLVVCAALLFTGCAGTPRPYAPPAASLPDSEAPRLGVTGTTRGAIVPSRGVAITVWFRAVSGRVVRLSARVASGAFTSLVVGDGFEQVSLPLPDLPPGPATVTITAKDDAGREGSIDWPLIADAAPPNLSASLRQGTSPPELAVEYSDDTGVLSVGYQLSKRALVQATECPLARWGQCTIALGDFEGLLEVVVAATDAADQTGYACLDVTGSAGGYVAVRCPQP